MKPNQTKKVPQQAFKELVEAVEAGKSQKFIEYEVKCEHPVKGNGAIDILATRPGEQVAFEVETGKSSIKKNLSKIAGAGFDQIVLVATAPAAVSTYQKAVDTSEIGQSPAVEMITWLDV